MNNIKVIEQFQKDAKKLNRDINSVEEFKLWLEAKKVAGPPIEWREQEAPEEEEIKEVTETPVEEKAPEEKKEEKPKERKTERFHVLNSSSGISTDKPLENEYVNDWDENRDGNGPETYLLIRSEKYSKPWILSGSGKPESYGVKVGDKVSLFDDINETTPFARYRGPGSRGTPGEILAIAKNANEIKNFPKGRYRLMVMK